MRRLAITLLLSTAAITAGHASTEVSGGKTRAQVQQELADAKTNGQVPFGELDDIASLPDERRFTSADLDAALNATLEDLKEAGRTAGMLPSH